jgi:hypothetical protein
VEVELEQRREHNFVPLVDSAHWRSDRYGDRHAIGSNRVYDSTVIAKVPQAA